MTREQTYAEQLKSLGIYDPAFEPEIHTLAIMERDLQKALKVWKKSDGEMVGKTWDAICSLRRDILQHRDALGLTPKAYKRIRDQHGPATDTGDVPTGGSNDKLSGVLDKLMEITHGNA